MKLNELARQLTALHGIRSAGDPRTFTYRVPFDDDNTHFFIRPVADDLVLASSVMRADDKTSTELGVNILDTAETHVAKTKHAEVTKLSNIKWPNRTFDALLLLDPTAERFSVTNGDDFLASRTIGAYAINHIEFSGNETIPEAIARRKHVILADVTRKIEPVIFLRYHKQTGQRSEKYLAVTNHEYATALIKEMPRDGGTVELENYERIRLSLATRRGSREIDAAFNGKTAKLSLEHTLKLMDTLTFKGAEDAIRTW